MSKQGSTICPHNEEPFQCMVCNYVPLKDTIVCRHTEDLISRLRKRAEIRRQIPGRKSVENGEPDRIADLLDEAADALTKLSPSAESDKKVTDLDTKNGVPFDAATEYLYQKKISQLKAELDVRLEALAMSAKRNGELSDENRRLREELEVKCTSYTPTTRNHGVTINSPSDKAGE